MNKNLHFFLASIVLLLVQSCKPSNQRIILDYELGMPYKELTEHTAKLVNSGIVNYSRESSNYSKIDYLFPLSSVESIEMEIDWQNYREDYLDEISIVIYPMDSLGTKEGQAGKLYKKFIETYGNPATPLYSEKFPDGDIRQYAVWDKGNFEILWQETNEKLGITYSAKGSLGRYLNNENQKDDIRVNKSL